jgi:hypothetical protein
MPPIRWVYLFLVMALLSCSKSNSNINYTSIQIPNGDFESWDGINVLQQWQTNSCPPCVPAYDSYVIKKVTDAEQGQFAAKFIYNSVFRSLSELKFPISEYPSLLTGYVRSTIASGDTAFIQVDLFDGRNIIETVKYLETSSTARYKKIQVQFNRTGMTVDSAYIRIEGGKAQGTEFTVDNLQFLKN